jgi:pSer/pThr/pTyr-binding forkhead associated (FHA) protein
MARIQFTTPDGNTFEADLTSDPMTVGRNEGNDLVIPDGSVSGSHGSFSQDGGMWVFTDNDSTNGTKISGERVQRVELGHGAQFEMGDVAVMFLDEESAPAQSTASRSSSQASYASAPADGYNSRPLDNSSRIGFGPKKHEKDGARGALMALGMLSLLAALGTIGLLLVSGL